MSLVLVVVLVYGVDLVWWVGYVDLVLMVVVVGVVGFEIWCEFFDGL